MGNIDVLTLLKFIDEYGGRTHVASDYEEANIGRNAENIEKQLQMYLGEKFHLDTSKKTQQWQNSGHITTYFWIQLKAYDCKHLPISISVFSERYQGGVARFRVTIEYDYKFSQDNKIDVFSTYKKIISFSNEKIPSSLKYFVSTDNKNSTNFLLESVNQNDLKQLYEQKRGMIHYYDETLSKVQVAEIDKLTRIQLSHIIANTDDNERILQEIEQSVKDLLPIYKNLVNSSLEEMKEGNEIMDNEKEKLVYSKKNDISIRYINSLLAKPFVILTGNSGTGKTRLATQFAKSLEKKIDDKPNHLLIPVGSDWTDNTKILGYYNPLANKGEGKYEKTPIFEFIELAGQNPDVPFFLILDEMNLSHVERYFSDFLSKMELIDYKDSEKKEYFNLTENLSLEFPKNLFITGTVNIDETTYMFSPKVLDRANVIEFKPDMKSVLDNIFDGTDGSVLNKYFNAPEEFLKTAKEIHDGSVSEEIKDELEEIREILESFYIELEKYGFEFAYRTVKEIRLYAIANYKMLKNDSSLDSTDIADIQILQKVLPKIHGNRKQIGELLDTLEGLCQSNSLSKSLEKIKQMKDRLVRFQYASFI